MANYRAEDFDPPSKALPVFCAAVLALACIGIGAWIGFRICEDACKAAKVAESLKPRVMLPNPPPRLIPCNDPLKSVEIVNQVCRGSMRSAKVGAK